MFIDGWEELKSVNISEHNYARFIYLQINLSCNIIYRNSRILSNTLSINLIAIIYVIQAGCKNIEQLDAHYYYF